MLQHAMPSIRLHVGAGGPLGVVLVSPQELEAPAAGWERWAEGTGVDASAAPWKRTRFRAAPETQLAWTGREGRLLWLVGCGDADSTAALRRAAASAVRLIPAGQEWTLAVPRLLEDGAPLERLGAVLEGLLLGAYRFRAGSDNGLPGTCAVRVAAAERKAAERVLARAQALCAGVYLTRDLVNTPAGDLGPEELADAAAALAARHGMRSLVYRGDELLEQGLRMVEAVGRASARPPTFTAIEVGEGASPPLAIVGKGVVFDSGGLNLKDSRGMLLMRKDMAGAATALGLLEALGALSATPHLLVVLPSAENFVGPRSYRPGDVLRSHAGKTVEIGNTDAEGRLLLADGLSYALGRGARRLLDLATLTGSARVALGPDVPALFGTEEALVRLVEEETARCDEPVWRMPLVDSYDEQLDTPFADLNHVSSDSRGGAITAALFLRRFTNGRPWAHLDFYGWEDKGRPEMPRGASGSLVRSLVGVVERLGELGQG